MNAGSLILDCEALSKVVKEDALTLTRLKSAQKQSSTIMVNAMTILEVRHPQLKQAQLDWILSSMVVVDASVDLIKEAAELLAAAGLHGHSHAIDAVVAATALRRPSPVVMLTSDPDDMRRLCGDSIVIAPA